MIEILLGSGVFTGLIMVLTVRRLDCQGHTDAAGAGAYHGQRRHGL